MDCKHFIATFTDYRDGLLAPGELDRLEGHLEGCASCRRYARVVEEGVRVLRSRPPVPVPADFRPRLRHRLYHLEDGDVLSAGSSGSGVSALAAAGMALLLTAVAWSPVMRAPEAPDVEVSLPPVVVRDPPEPVTGLTLPASAFFGDPEPTVRPRGGGDVRETPRLRSPEPVRLLEPGPAGGGPEPGLGSVRLP